MALGFIADDFTSINARMQQLANEARHRDHFVPPNGVIIILSTELTNIRLSDIRMSNSIEAAFMLHMPTDQQPRIMLVLCRGSKSQNLAKMLEHVQGCYPSAYLTPDGEIALSCDDAFQLIQRLRELEKAS